jgi:hypothetical protein
MTWAAASHNPKYWHFGHLIPKWHCPWKRWHCDNTQCKHSIPKAQTHWYILWEDNICLGHGLLSYFLVSTLITTCNQDFAIFLASPAWCVPIFFFLLTHTNWTDEIEYQPLIDLMEMFCNLGNQIGRPWHGLQPHTMKNIGILAILQENGTAHEKVGSVTILNVNTPFQRLRPIDISYGKTISAWAMDCYLDFYSAH